VVELSGGCGVGSGVICDNDANDDDDGDDDEAIN
jgi:hypothetical protein